MFGHILTLISVMFIMSCELASLKKLFYVIKWSQPYLNLVKKSFNSLQKFTMTTTGFVLIFLARAAYRRLLVDSEMLDLAGETHVI